LLPPLSLLQVLGSESALVDDITTPGGVRALPDPKDLRRFVDTASSMDGLTIAELLREKMVRGRGAAGGCVLQEGLFEQSMRPCKNNKEKTNNSSHFLNLSLDQSILHPK
jgi:hypothetical protein